MKAIICIVVLFALLFAAQARRSSVMNVKAVGGTVTCEGEHLYLLVFSLLIPFLFASHSFFLFLF
jgi:hypothetical protein